MRLTPEKWHHTWIQRRNPKEGLLVVAQRHLPFRLAATLALLDNRRDHERADPTPSS